MAQFYPQGIHLDVVSYISQRGREYGASKRVALREELQGCSTAVLLPSPSNHGVVQLKRIVEGTKIERVDAVVADAVVVREIAACVGERVLLSETLRSRTEQSGTVGTVIAYRHESDTYDIIVCKDEGARLEANHLLHIPALCGEILKDVHASELTQRCPALTTKDIVEELIKPYLEVKRSSLCEALEAGMRQEDERGPLSGLATFLEDKGIVHPVQAATAFVSHAWKYQFEDLAVAVEAVVEGEVKASPYMWLDICTVNQVEQQQLPKDYFYSTFKQGIEQIGHTILVLQPWTDPIPLKRSWCLWEIHSTSTTGATLQVAMGASERADFQKALNTKFDGVYDLLTRIDVEKAEAWGKDDQETILQLAREADGGTSKLNGEIKEPLREWLAQAGIEAAAAEDASIDGAVRAADAAASSRTTYTRESKPTPPTTHQT